MTDDEILPCEGRAMSDIVERLRNNECDCLCRTPVELEAADEIEQLRARLAEAEALLRGLRDEFYGLPRVLGNRYTHLGKLDAFLAGDKS